MMKCYSLLVFLCFVGVQSVVALEDGAAEKTLLDSLDDRVEQFLYVDLDTARFLLQQKSAITSDHPDQSLHAITMAQYGQLHINLGNGDSSLYYLEKSLSISTELGDTLYMSKTLNRIATAYKNLGREEDALAAYAQIFKYHESLTDTLGLASAHANIGLLYMQRADMTKALHHLLKAKGLMKAVGHAIFEGTVCNTIGLVYRQLDDVEQEIAFFEEGYDILIQESDSMRVGILSVNLGSAYLKHRPEKTELGLRLLEDAERLFTNMGYPRGVLGVYDAYASYYFLVEKNYERAIHFCDQSIGLGKEIGSDLHVADAHAYKGNVYKEMGKAIEAIEAFKVAANIAEEHQYVQILMKSSEALSELLEKAGDVDAALRYYHLFLTSKDSLLNEDKIKELKEIELIDEHQQQQLKDSLETLQERQMTSLAYQQDLADEQQNKRLLFFVIVLVLVGAVLIAIALVRNRKQAALLEEKNAAIEKALHEKQLLLKEVHHRVKNNFQIVSSLLDLQTKGIEDDKALALAQEGKNRVNSMALIHKRLYENDDLLVFFNEYIERLVADISASYGNGNQTQISIKAPDVRFDIDTAIPLGLIVNELVTNAFKYGMTNAQPQLKISIQKADAENYQLTVADNGEGIPTSIDLSKAKSLGLRLVRRLSQQLQGSFSYTKTEGSCFVVLFKDSAMRANVD